MTGILVKEFAFTFTLEMGLHVCSRFNCCWKSQYCGTYVATEKAKVDIPVIMHFQCWHRFTLSEYFLAYRSGWDLIVMLELHLLFVSLTTSQSVQCRSLTSHSTHYRSFWDDFYRPDDQTDSVKALKETNWSSRAGLNLTRARMWHKSAAWKKSSPGSDSVKLELSWHICGMSDIRKIKLLAFDSMNGHTESALVVYRTTWTYIDAHIIDFVSVVWQLYVQAGKDLIGERKMRIKNETKVTSRKNRSRTTCWHLEKERWKSNMKPMLSAESYYCTTNWPRTTYWCFLWHSPPRLKNFLFSKSFPL